MDKRLVAAGLIALAASAGAQTPEELAYPVRTDWSSSDDKINLSMFLYHDVNRSGTYDLPDRALSGILVGLARDGEGLSAAHTNANGFANFKSSTSPDEEETVIDVPGAYLFQAVVPPGWQLTTGNDAQTLEITELPGSISGLGVERMLVPVGMAQILTISGRHPGGAGQTVRLHRDGLDPREVQTGPDGSFSFAAEPGIYHVIADDLGQRVEVTEAPVRVGTLRAPVAADAPRTIHFDDYPYGGVTKVPNDYGGLGWFNLNFLRRDFSSAGNGYTNGTTSQPFGIYTSSGISGEISRDTPFVFDGAMFSVAWKDAHGETAIIEAWNGDEKVFEERFALSILGPVNLQPRLGPVTRVKVSTLHQWQMMIDDLSYSELSD